MGTSLTSTKLLGRMNGSLLMLHLDNSRVAVGTPLAERALDGNIHCILYASSCTPLFGLEHIRLFLCDEVYP